MWETIVAGWLNLRPTRFSPMKELWDELAAHLQAVACLLLKELLQDIGLLKQE